jgi:hypothetical protein
LPPLSSQLLAVVTSAPARPDQPGPTKYNYPAMGMLSRLLAVALAAAVSAPPALSNGPRARSGS